MTLRRRGMKEIKWDMKCSTTGCSKARGHKGKHGSTKTKRKTK